MAQFYAQLTDTDPTHKEAYLLFVEGPLSDDDRGTPSAQRPVYVIPEISGCVICKDLAKEYDPDIEEGDVLYLTIVEEDVHANHTTRYTVGMTVRFIKWPGLIRFSPLFLWSMFDMNKYEKDSPDGNFCYLCMNLRSCEDGPI